jgi:hypothetical protein
LAYIFWGGDDANVISSLNNGGYLFFGIIIAAFLPTNDVRLPTGDWLAR